jgi:hypothetical protein
MSAQTRERCWHLLNDGASLAKLIEWCKMVSSNYNPKRAALKSLTALKIMMKKLLTNVLIIKLQKHSAIFRNGKL